MDRISTATAVPDLFGAGKPGFRDGNKALGILPTDLNALLFNSIQEELMNVIEGAGLSADDADFTQLRQAIQAMIINGQKSVIIHDAVFEASVADEDVVYWHAGNGEFTKAVADGSAAQNAVGFADVTNEKVYAFGAAPIFAGLTPGAYYLDTVTPGAITATPPSANIVKLGLAISATEIYVDIDAASGTDKKPGEIFDWGGTTAPAGSLACPTSPTNISRTTYAALFAAIGTTWGAGDGSTTFGMPWFPADYAAVQANSNVGTQTTGEVIAHTHDYTRRNSGSSFTGGGGIDSNNNSLTVATTSTGGAANKAAGSRVLKCVKY